jgi:hypothetical protein
MDKASYQARIAKAAGDRDLRERAKEQTGSKIRRARGHAGERLGCGCLPEDEEQRQLLAWCEMQGIVLHWTRGERRENARLRAWASARGAREGIPDLIALSHPGLAVELKAECRKHKLSDTQRRRIEYMRCHGWTVIVAHGARDGIRQIEEWRKT